jgi:hypothetical protein
MSLTHYDPDNAPDPREWMGMAEAERIRLAQNHHVAARVKLPNVKAHAVLHSIVENQVAEGFGPTVRALERLQREGLSRHEAVHAVGSVIAKHVFETQRTSQPPDVGESQRLLNSQIEALSAENWRKHEREG